MPLSNVSRVLSWDQETIDSLVAKACEVAQKVGLCLEDDSRGVYLKEAESKGLKVDWPARAVMFTAGDIAETIAAMRQTAPAPQPLRERPKATSRESRFTVGNSANMLFDWDRWQVKQPTRKDLAEVCMWAQGCDDVECLWPPVRIQDVDLALAPMYSYAVMAKYCRKDLLHEHPTLPIHVVYLDKMARVIEKRRGFLQPMQEWEYVNAPMKMGFRAIETVLLRFDLGICKSVGVGSMAIKGMTAPVAIAGLAVMAVAESLAGLTLLRVLRPGIGLRGGAATGTLDLRTGRVSYFGMQCHLQNIAAWELFVRGLGVDATCFGFYREANEPGMQATYEFGMAQAFFSGLVEPVHAEIGGLGNGSVFSPEQAVLDMELAKEFNELADGFEVSEEAIGLDDIVGYRFESAAHMASERTLAHMLDGVPFSSFLFRGLTGPMQHEKGNTQTDQLMAKAAKAVKTDREKGRKAGPDAEIANELYELVEQAAGELGIEAPPLP